MSITITPQGEHESQVHIDGGESDVRSVVIHPWKAGVGGREDSHVYISVGVIEPDGTHVYLLPDGSYAPLDAHGFPLDEDAREDYTNAIIDRDAFIEGILAVFPELRRAES